MDTTITLRFYEELNDFLPPDRRKKSFIHTFKGMPNIKDVIESVGVPHTEIDLIIVNGHSVDFNYKPNQDDRVSIYPMFESLDISPLTHLRPKPLRVPKFVLDVHLGKLARYLRLLGFDVLYTNHYTDPELIEIALAEKRIILTRDVFIFKNKSITHGYWIRSTAFKHQLKEVIHRFDLQARIIPFSRCIECNGILGPIEKNIIASKIPRQVSHCFDDYHECLDCHKIYWKGSHYDKLKAFVENFIKELKIGIK